MTEAVIDLHDTANSIAADRLTSSDPKFADVRPAGEAVPGMTPNTILVSGAPLPWEAYQGGQRRAVLGAAVFEGLAADFDEAERRIESGDILVRPSHDHSTVGSLTGACTWSMPVIVVRDEATGSTGLCRINEGPSTDSLTFGVWSEAVGERLRQVRDVIAPALGAVIRDVGGLPLRPLMRQALAMGDDLHSRHTASGSLLRGFVLEALLDGAGSLPDAQRADLVWYLREARYLFLHLAMAAAKAAADSAAGVPGSSVVTAMTLSAREFSIRVSGLGNRWFRAPLPDVSTLQGRLDNGARPADLEYVGGESLITEVIGLGGMAAATSPALQSYSAGSARGMLELTTAMYGITVAEHPHYLIPALDFRGVPVGVDARLVAETGVTPAIHLGATLKSGGHAGAVLFKPPAQPFADAFSELHKEAAAPQIPATEEKNV